MCRLFHPIIVYLLDFLLCLCVCVSFLSFLFNQSHWIALEKSHNSRAIRTKDEIPFARLMLIYHRCACCIFIQCMLQIILWYCRIFSDDVQCASYEWKLSRMNRSENSSCHCVNTVTQNVDTHTHTKKERNSYINLANAIWRSLCTRESKLTNPVTPNEKKSHHKAAIR